MPSPPYLPGGFLLFSLTTFSAASFRLLSLGFHGLCLFFFFFWWCDPYDTDFASLFCLMNVEGKAHVSVMER